jgi:hypothetical protein
VALSEVWRAAEDLAAELQRFASVLRAIPLEEEPGGEPLPPPRAAEALLAPDSAPGGCDCTLYARCAFHEAHRPKGCTCNGPYFSATCKVETHATKGRAWPAGDPAAVE